MALIRLLCVTELLTVGIAAILNHVCILKANGIYFNKHFHKTLKVYLKISDLMTFIYTYKEPF